ncbi:hypothetical protein OROGR_002098 [Orobanche gracilis]
MSLCPCIAFLSEPDQETSYANWSKGSTNLVGIDQYYFRVRRGRVQLLRKKLLLEENENPKPESCDPIILSPLDFQPKNEFLSQDAASYVAPETAYKQDDAASSGKSDVFDSDSPHYTSHDFEHDPSDFSQGEDESLLHFPKIEVECYDDLQPNSCNLGFPVQDQGTWFWQYY